MNYRKIFRRSIIYIKNAYSLISIPFQFIAYTSSIYYLMINNVYFLKKLFPHFTDFLRISFLFFFGFILIGYFYTKKTKMIIEGIEINQEINPYSNYKIPKVQIPSYQANIELCKKHDIDTKEMERILENSIK